MSSKILTIEPCPKCGCVMEADAVFVDDDGTVIVDVKCTECSQLQTVKVKFERKLGDPDLETVTTHCAWCGIEVEVEEGHTGDIVCEECARVYKMYNEGLA
ncbi:MAG: hypothetical protein JXA33_10875 [Anaerolineae bacterium]|nr:hypothetical protein [Anaerolineae bacterium]